MSELWYRERHEWVETGIRNGYITAPVCSTHDGTPTTAEEDDDIEQGDDPCIVVLRICEPMQQSDIYDNTPALQWRDWTRQ